MNQDGGKVPETDTQGERILISLRRSIFAFQSVPIRQLF
jgi:hypothetical protein